VNIELGLKKADYKDGKCDDVQMLSLMFVVQNIEGYAIWDFEGKRPLGRPRHRWIDIIKMDLVEIGFSVVD
jgi:hypothetical protein